MFRFEKCTGNITPMNLWQGTLFRSRFRRAVICCCFLERLDDLVIMTILFSGHGVDRFDKLVLSYRNWARLEQHRSSMIEGIRNIVKMATKTLSALVTDCSLQFGAFLLQYVSFCDVKWQNIINYNLEYGKMNKIVAGHSAIIAWQVAEVSRRRDPRSLSP